MKIAVIGAMVEEITFLQKTLENKKTSVAGPYTFYTGNIERNDIIVVAGGIGKVASALVFAALIHEYPGIDLLINVGVCGGLAGRVNEGDLIIPDIVAYADVDLTAFSEYEYGQMANCPLYFRPDIDLISGLCLPPYSGGAILSGDGFFADEKKTRETINTHYPNINVVGLDMETAALAQCAYIYKVSFLAVRTVSDLIGVRRQIDDYNKNKEKSAVAANALLFEILKNIGK